MILINGMVIYNYNCGSCSITSKENYEARIQNARAIMTFNGTLEEACEYVKKYFGEKHEE